MDDRFDDLFRAWQAGDAQAFERLLEAVTPYLTAVASARASAAVLALDGCSGVVQNTKLKALRAVRDGARLSFDGPGAFRGWLTRILRNDVFEQEQFLRRDCRDVRRTVPLGDDSRGGAPLADPAPSPSSQAAAHEETALFRAAVLNRLPPEERAVLLWPQERAWSDERIAAELGLTVERVRQIRATVVLRLRRRGPA